MLAEVKEIWKSITDKDVPVGIIFSLIVIDCIFTTEQITTTLLSFVSKGTITIIHTLSGTIYTFAVWASIAALGVLFFIACCRGIINKIRKGGDLWEVEKMMISLQIEFENIYKKVAVLTIIITLTKHILGKPIAANFWPTLALMLDVVVVLGCLGTTTSNKLSNT